MALKALIFAGSYNQYLDFIGEYHLKGTECKFVRDYPDTQGYHKDTNPDLLLIFLESFWLTEASFSLMAEFNGQIYRAEGAEAAARLIQLTYITRQEQLPEYLSHEDETVREAALKRQEELDG